MCASHVRVLNTRDVPSRSVYERSPELQKVGQSKSRVFVALWWAREKCRGKEKKNEDEGEGEAEGEADRGVNGKERPRA